MKLKNDIVNLIVRVEHHLCPQYCGVVDRRRVIAFLLLTISELIIIPYHIMLFLPTCERTLWFKPLWLAYIRVLHPAVPGLETEDSFRERYFFSLLSDVRQTGS